MRNKIIVVFIGLALTNCKSPTKSNAYENHNSSTCSTTLNKIKNEGSPPDNSDINQASEIVIGEDNLTDSSNAFDFNEISVADFEKYKSGYKSFFVRNITQGIPILLVKTKDSCFSFNSVSTNGKPYFKLQGLIEPINLYVLDAIDSKNAIGYKIMIDSMTNVKYRWVSPFDSPLDSVLISPNKNYLLSYCNSIYEEKKSFISVLKILKDEKGNLYKDFCGFDSNDWQVKEAVWSDSMSFVLKVYDSELPNEKGGENKLVNVKYLKLNISAKKGGL